MAPACLASVLPAARAERLELQIITSGAWWMPIRRPAATTLFILPTGKNA